MLNHPAQPPTDSNEYLSDFAQRALHQMIAGEEQAAADEEIHEQDEEDWSSDYLDLDLEPTIEPEPVIEPPAAQVEQVQVPAPATPEPPQPVAERSPGPLERVVEQVVPPRPPAPVRPAPKMEDQASKVINVLLERIEHTIEERINSSNKKAEQSASVADTQIKNSISRFVSSELPRIVRDEISSILRAEVAKAITSEFSLESNREFGRLERNLSKIVDKFESFERRMARMEAAVDREIVVKIPENAINVTVPERSVEVKAPVVKVEPPQVQFGESAINVTFQKSQEGKVTRQIDFERDRDNNIKSARIVDTKAPSKKPEKR